MTFELEGTRTIPSTAESRGDDKGAARAHVRSRARKGRHHSETKAERASMDYPTRIAFLWGSAHLWWAREGRSLND